MGIGPKPLSENRRALFTQVRLFASTFRRSPSARDDTADYPVEINETFDGVQKLETRCERRGQLEIGIVTHNGSVFASFGASVSGHNVTGYTRHRNGYISLTRWCGSTMLACRSEIVRSFTTARSP
jgi:hypothetical protein